MTSDYRREIERLVRSARLEGVQSARLSQRAQSTVDLRWLIDTCEISIKHSSQVYDGVHSGHFTGQNYGYFADNVLYLDSHSSASATRVTVAQTIGFYLYMSHRGANKYSWDIPITPMGETYNNLHLASTQGLSAVYAYEYAGALLVPYYRLCDTPYTMSVQKLAQSFGVTECFMKYRLQQLENTKPYDFELSSTYDFGRMIREQGGYDMF